MTSARGLALVVDFAHHGSSTAAAIVLATAASCSLQCCWNPLKASALSKDFGTAWTPSKPTSTHPVLKHQQVKPQSLWSVFSPKTLLFSLVKSALLPFVSLVDEWFEQVKQAEQAAIEEDRDTDWPPFPKERLRPACITASFHFAKDMGVTLLRRALENYVWRYAPVDWGNKLLKDFRPSAVRKQKRLPWYVLPYKVTLTTVRSAALGYGSECIVSICIDAVRYWRSEGRKNSLGQTWRHVVSIVTYNAYRCTVSLVVASVGSGLGSLLLYPFPSTGCMLSFTAADAVSQFLLVPYLLQLS